MVCCLPIKDITLPHPGFRGEAACVSPAVGDISPSG
jgi:hypothetical protein